MRLFRKSELLGIARDVSDVNLRLEQEPRGFHGGYEITRPVPVCP
jgi:hypothetical protein